MKKKETMKSIIARRNTVNVNFQIKNQSTLLTGGFDLRKLAKKSTIPFSDTQQILIDQFTGASNSPSQFKLNLKQKSSFLD